MAWYSAFGRWGRTLLEAVDWKQGAVRSIQRHLSSSEPAAAWAEGEQLRNSPDPLDVEALATLGVSAAATGRNAEALQYLREAERLASLDGELTLEAAVRSLINNSEMLLQQSRGEGTFSFGPNWIKEKPLTELSSPLHWKTWVGAMPSTAEYVGPVETRWEDEGKCRRGQFTSRCVSAGETLLAFWPIAWAENSGESLVAELKQACQLSARSRRRLECLSDGRQGHELTPPEIVNEALRPIPDDLPLEDKGRDHLFDFHGIIRTNAFRTSTSGSAAIYGLPSMFNHSCDGHEGSVVKHIRSDGTIIFWAARDFSEGEVLFHRYFPCDGSLQVRHEFSSNWGFTCGCKRCFFEGFRLPGTQVAVSIDAAVYSWQEQFRPKIRELASSLPAGGAGDITAQGDLPHWDFLNELLAAANAVETSVAKEDSWGEAELACCLSLIQPLSNAALWCLFSSKDNQKEGAEQFKQHQLDALDLRGQVLSRIVLAWGHMERYGFDHLKNMHLHWLARHEACTLLFAGVNAGGIGEQVSLLTYELAEVEARNCCEHGFWIRFGVSAADLRLGAPDSPAAHLLRQLKQ